MIIVEGADATGKTTLAKKISEAVGWPLEHSGGPPRGPGEIVRRTCDYLCSDQPKVFDRFPLISEPIYARALGRQCGFAESELKILLKSMYHLRPFVIWCSTELGSHEVKPTDTVEHLEGITEKREEILELYRQWWKDSLPFLRYRRDDPSSDGMIISFAINYAKFRR